MVSSLRGFRSCRGAGNLIGRTVDSDGALAHARVGYISEEHALEPSA